MHGTRETSCTTRLVCTVLHAALLGVAAWIYFGDGGVLVWGWLGVGHPFPGDFPRRLVLVVSCSPSSSTRLGSRCWAGIRRVHSARLMSSGWACLWLAATSIRGRSCSVRRSRNAQKTLVASTQVGCSAMRGT